jgi:hypothetical protein
MKYHRKLDIFAAVDRLVAACRVHGKPSGVLASSAETAEAAHPKLRFAGDSPLEGTGFEPSVPRGKCPTLRVSAVLSAGIRSPCKSQRSGP